MAKKRERETLKKMIVLVVMSLLLLAACTNSNENEKPLGEIVKEDEAALNTSGNDRINEKEKQELTNSKDTSAITETPEYNSLTEIVNIADYQLDTEVDNPQKRIILLENQNGKEMYKSIFIKETGRLKIIEFDKGLIFNDLIG